MKRESGMVLLNTVILLSLFALLFLSQTQIMALYLDSSHLFKRNQAMKRELEQKALKLLRSINTEQNCRANEMDFAHKKAWLLQKGCPLRGDKAEGYRYLIEDLGTFACLRAFKGKQSYATKHYRINLMHMGEGGGILQVRMAELLDKENLPCEEDQSRSIKIGVLNWL